METKEPLSLWQLAVLAWSPRTHTVGYQPRKRTRRNRRENAKNIRRELGFLCCWYNEALLVLITAAQARACDFIEKNSEPH